MSLQEILQKYRPESFQDKLNQRLVSPPFDSYGMPKNTRYSPLNLMDVGFLGNVGTPAGPNVFTENYGSNAGWTEATNITVTGGELLYNARVTNPVTTRKNIGFTFSDTLWFAEYEFNPSAETNPDSHFYFSWCLAAGTGIPPTTTQDALVQIYANSFSDYRWGIVDKDGSTEGQLQNTNAQTFGLVFPRFERTSATGVKLSFFTNSIRTIEQTGSPLTPTIVSTIIGLNVLHHSTAAASSSTTTTMTYDTLVIRDAVAP